MIYRISLIECGHVTHSWHFTDLQDAIRHMDSLSRVFDEVNEVTPIMCKCTSAEATHKLKGLINNLIID